jgi:DNA topoisomerase-1
LAADSKIKGDNDQRKYERARRLKACIKNVRDAYTKRMQSDDLSDNQLGVCTYLIDKLALRVGNEKGEDEADTVGCCSLRVEHIIFEVDSKITLDFLGKDSMRYFNTIPLEPIVYKLLQSFTSTKKPEEEIFDRINPSKINEFLKNFMDDLSAKVFRTYNASITLQEELQREDDKLKETDTADCKTKFYNDCNRTVAILCNHQKSVSKNHEE